MNQFHTILVGLTGKLLLLLYLFYEMWSIKVFSEKDGAGEASLGILNLKYSFALHKVMKTLLSVNNLSYYSIHFKMEINPFSSQK